MIRKYHYSDTLPKINKHFYGFYLKNELVGVVTLGLGTRPKQTIQRLFPNMQTNEYYEIGRMCMTEDMPRNSESQMLSLLCKYIKKTEPQIKVLFTFADGMLGKAGYVYQASGFMYAGYSETDMYIMGGVKIHARGTRRLFQTDPNDKRMSIRPTKQQMRQYGVSHYRGRQYRYVRFLCGKVEKRRLIKQCLVSLSEPFPKDKDMYWRKLNLDTGKWELTTLPPYTTDNKEGIKRSFAKANEDYQVTLEDYMKGANT